MDPSPQALSSKTRASVFTLPAELFTQILDSSSYDSLRSLSLTCKPMHEHCQLPIKYRKVDLSVHNLGLQPFKQWDGRIQEYWSDRWPPKFDVEKLAQKQQSFISEILDPEEPHLCKLVHELSWTIRSHWPPNAQTNSGREPKDDLDERMWEAFQKLTNVTKLDLGCYQESWDWVYLRAPPQKLFPNASDVRLSGVMYPQIAKSVLSSSSLPKLERLELDNLQDPGRWHGIAPFQIIKARTPGPWPSLWVDDEYEHNRIPGPIRGVIPLMASGCDNLKSFKYRRRGWTTPKTGLNAHYDHDVYVEVGQFLRSVSRTIEEFSFEHGIPESQVQLYKDGTIHEHIGSSVQRRMPMDELLEQQIISALLATQWPALRKVALTVGVWKGRPGIGKAAINRLKRHLGEQVEVSIADINDHPCEIYLGE